MYIISPKEKSAKLMILRKCQMAYAIERMRYFHERSAKHVLYSLCMYHIRQNCNESNVIVLVNDIV